MVLRWDENVCVCGWNEFEVCSILAYPHQFILYYTSAIHKHTHTRILKPFEDSEPTRLIADIARNPDMNAVVILREKEM